MTDPTPQTFAPFTDSYQSSRPSSSNPYKPISATKPSANPFANASYRSPLSVSGSDDNIRVNKYDTSLGWRVDVEAALCYGLLALGGPLFLIAEQKNDYVRFHAWQSILVNAALLLVLFVCGWISSTLVWIVFGVACGINLFIAFKAYQNGSTLERFRVLFAGHYAAHWVDTE
jgi:uncharacterized membrane protein